MKIVSFNINSIRARPHQLIHLRDTIDPDIIGIQETKVDDPEFPIEEIKEIGYHPEFWGQKGHYGVAILSKKKPSDVQKGFDINIDNDYLLNEGTEILSDYILLNQNTYLSQAA